jgi:RecB family exonuclease
VLRILAAFLTTMLFVQPTSRADEVERSLFLVVEADGVIASNTQTGRFDRLDLAAKERILDYKTGNAVAVVVTNQRFAGYAVLAGGWQTLRREAGEEHESIQAEDYAATVVTDDRLLNFNGRTGAWRQIRRSVQLR